MATVEVKQTRVKIPTDKTFIGADGEEHQGFFRLHGICVEITTGHGHHYKWTRYLRSGKFCGWNRKLGVDEEIEPGHKGPWTEADMRRDLISKLGSKAIEPLQQIAALESEMAPEDSGPPPLPAKPFMPFNGRAACSAADLPFLMAAHEGPFAIFTDGEGGFQFVEHEVPTCMISRLSIHGWGLILER